MTKAQFIWAQYQPELPEWPLPADIQQAAETYEGPMPTSLGEFIDLVTHEQPPTVPS